VTSRELPALGTAVKPALIVVLLLLTAACGAYRFPGGPPPGMGTVTGMVTVMPCGPVEPAQPGIAPCKMKPAAGLEVDFSGDGIVTSTRTDGDGRYTIQLAEGTYKVSVKNYMRVISGPPAVTVKAGQTVVADYVLDSGIRTAQQGEPR
jgi:hypothetical protein